MLFNFERKANAKQLFLALVFFVVRNGDFANFSSSIFEIIQKMSLLHILMSNLDDPEKISFTSTKFEFSSLQMSIIISIAAVYCF